MEDSVKEDVVLAYSYVIIFLLGSKTLNYDSTLLELKYYFSNIVEGSSTKEEFLEAIYNVIEELEEHEAYVPDWLIDIKAYVEVNI